MIKDAVVNLPVGNSKTRVVDFAVSVASTFDAHLAGVAFVYESVRADDRCCRHPRRPD